jgi:predicted Zn-dependent protease
VVATYGGVYKDPGAERAVASVVGRLVEASEDPAQSYKITILIPRPSTPLRCPAAIYT